MTGSVEEEILELRARYRSDRDPSGRGFAPLADALRRAGRLDEAAALVDEGLAVLPDFCAGHLVAAWVHRDRGDTEGAQVALREVLRLDPLNVLALRHLARFREDAGDDGEAGDLMARAAGVDGGAGEYVDSELLVTGSTTTPPEVDVPDGPGGSGGAEGSLADAEPGEVGEAEGAETRFPASDEAPAGDLPDANPDWFVDSWGDGEEEAEEPPFPGEGVHTRTMAELYASQGLLDRAVEVYQDLVDLDPGNDELTARLAELVERRRLRRTQGQEAVVSAADTPREAVSAGVAETAPEAAPEAAPDAAEATPDAAEAATPVPVERVAPGFDPDADADADDTAALLHLPTGGDLVESPFSWIAPTSPEPGEAEGAGVPVADFFDGLLSWVPAESGDEGEAPVESAALGTVEVEAVNAVDAPETVDGLEAVDGLQAVEEVQEAGVSERVEVGFGVPDSGGYEPLPSGPPGSPDHPVSVEDLAPDGELPSWVPVEFLAPAGPLPHWVPISELAPDPAATTERSPTLDSPPPPDATDDEFRAWLERLRL